MLGKYKSFNAMVYSYIGLCYVLLSFLSIFFLFIKFTYNLSKLKCFILFAFTGKIYKILLLLAILNVVQFIFLFYHMSKLFFVGKYFGMGNLLFYLIFSNICSIIACVVIINFEFFKGTLILKLKHY